MTEGYREVLTKDKSFIRGRVNFYYSLAYERRLLERYNLLAQLNQSLGKVKLLEEIVPNIFDPLAVELEEWKNYLIQSSQRIQEGMELEQREISSRKKVLIPEDAEIELTDPTGT